MTKLYYKQWINNLDTPLSDLEKKVLEVCDGWGSYSEIAELAGIKSAHVNNILTKLKKRGLIEKVWRRKPFIGKGDATLPRSVFNDLQYIAESDDLARNDSLENVMEWIGSDITRMRFVLNYAKKASIINAQTEVSEKLDELVQIARERLGAK